jgi:RNA recognition motif-containing protein
MSSDYRPRGGSEGSGRSSEPGGGGRRRRGGRGRSGGQRSGSHGENRVHTNGGPSSAPKKEKSLLSKLFGWLAPKKSKPETKQPYRSSAIPAESRTEFKERTPGAERTDRAERPERTERTERAERPRREDRPPKAEPTPQEIVSPKLYVGNLAYEAAESDLHDLFSKVGLVKNVEVARDRHSQRSKGFGFVEMESLDTAKDAAAKLNRTDFMGRQIVVSGAKVDKRPVPSNPREADPTSQEADVMASEPEPQHEHKPEAGSSSPEATA